MLTSPIRSEWTPACIAGHHGVWMIEPGYARTAAAAIMRGTAPVRQMEGGDDPGRSMWNVTGDGLGVLSLSGPMQKFDSKHGGVNTTRARKIVRQAARDTDVRAVMLLIDSPGGSADGTLELADEVASLARAKPTATHVSGVMASAALWVGVQTGRVTADRADLVGSIGTYAVVEDWSKHYEQQGVAVHVVAVGGAEDGGVKGAGVEGAPVTAEYLAEVRRIATGFNDLFLAGFASGRGMSMDDARKLADGRVHLAPDAVKLGLIDAVESADQAAANLMAVAASRGRRTGTARARMELDR